MNSVIYLDNDSRLFLRGLKDATGAFVTAAVVTLEEFKDRHGVDVTGLSLPMALAHVQDGDYSAIIPNTIGVSAEKRYFMRVRAEFVGLRAEWRESVICREREA